MCVSSSGTLRNDLTTASGTLRNDLTTASGALRSNDTAISGYFQSKTQNIAEYSPTGMRLTGNVGVNYPVRPDTALSVLKSDNNKTIYGVVIQGQNIMSTNGEYSANGSYTLAVSIVNTGIVNVGNSCASTLVNLRNITNNDAGGLSGLYGAVIAYGHADSLPQSPITDSAVGLYVSCYAASGTINRAYDILLSNSGINVTNHWGIYQIDKFNNYLNGNLGLGIDMPTKQLDINSDSIRLRSSKTPASGNAIGNTGDMCWDNNYLYVCVSTNSWKRSAISAW